MWTWNPDKAASNLKKHGVSFHLAQRVFEDPGSISEPDEHDDGDRWRTIGRPALDGLVVLFVVHTDRRIISARKAEPDEVEAYHGAQG